MNEVPWYRRWFGKEYLELYPHRDEEEAERGVELLLDETALSPGAPVLDLACGAGRHLRVLRNRGMRAVGLDLSAPLLLRSRLQAEEAPLVRGDMRVLPFAGESFQAVTSFFTSFGYFPDEADDGRLLDEVRRTLRRDGYYLLDFLNADRVRRTLSPSDEGEVGGRTVEIERRIIDGDRWVEKKISFPDDESGPARVFRERVRLYRPEELESLLERHGLLPEVRFGDYRGGPFRESSPRVILLARAR